VIIRSPNAAWLEQKLFPALPQTERLLCLRQRRLPLPGISSEWKAEQTDFLFFYMICKVFD